MADHRIAMAFSVAALFADGPVTIRNADCVGISFPGFFSALEGIAIRS
jgi:3-phosphoshikimate 1-carboxyvinyltransferase